MTCTYCLYNKDINGTLVRCDYFNEMRLIPENCAAKCLTIEGWEKLAQEAEKRGDMERANMYYENASNNQEF